MIIAGSGHRPDKLGGYGDDAFDRLVSIAHQWIEKNKPGKVISGMALGWDQALMQAAIDCEVPERIAAVPFRGYESMWPRSSQDYFWDLITHSTAKIILHEGGYEGWKMQDRNKFMVDNCDTVLAMFDGSTGGTNNCLKYARKMGKNIVNLYDVWKR